MCVCVCVCVGGGGGVRLSKTFVSPFPLCPPSRGNTVPYLPKIYGNPVPAGRNSVLELSFDA